MAFFKFRKGGEDQASAAPQPESVEVMRKRAKHRLIGAVVLVLAGVVGFPLLVDKQPRPIAVDIPIEIPDKNKTKPLVSGSLSTAPLAQDIITESAEPRPSAAVTSKTDTAAVVEASAKPVADKPADKPVDKAADKPADKPAEKSVEKSTDKSATAASDKSLDKPKAADKDAARAQALLEGKEPARDSAKAAGEDRYVVQIGAFADAAKAREARLKVERDGLKTYTQVVESKEGRRIRVRVGPFSSKAEADKAADKIKKLDLPAAILSL